MREILSVSVSKQFKRKVSKASKQYGLSQSDIVKNAVDKYLVSIEFYNLRKKLKRFAEKKGYLTDEDIFGDKDIS
jgi:hypothetical protein